MPYSTTQPIKKRPPQKKPISVKDKFTKRCRILNIQKKRERKKSFEILVALKDPHTKRCDKSRFVQEDCVGGGCHPIYQTPDCPIPPVQPH